MQKFQSNAVAKFNGKKIAIKTERDIEIRLQIKKESNVTNKRIVAKTKSIQNDWETEKSKLIDQIVALKNENQRNHLALKKKESEYANILLEKQKVEQKLSENDVQFSLQMTQMQRELKDAKQSINNIKASNDKIISDLKREKSLLLARNKQLQTGMEQQQKSAINTAETARCFTMKSPSENYYEVEKILAHKTVRTHQQYLIRWKGYDSNEDTWEKASDLKCPKILNEYLDSIKKKK